MSFAVFALAALVSPALAQDADELRQVAGILDYVGADYAGAVDASGQIVHQGEYDEQLQLTGDAIALARRGGVREGDPVLTGLAELQTALGQRPHPDQIRDRCRAIKEALVRGHDVILTPPSDPEAQRAAELYVAQGCPTCHGENGDADTDAARALDPRPANFLDPERVADVSPYRAFYAISFGVRGTGMTAYDRLGAQDRWSLAFYVLAMRHREADLPRGRAAFARAGVDRDLAGAAALSQLTERDLDGRLAAAIPNRADRAAAIAWLRARAPFAAGESGTFLIARRQLREAATAYRNGDRDGARRIFVAAYLDGFEPHEASLRARDSDLVAQIEREMLQLREAAASGVPVAQIERRVDRVSGLLDRAERGSGSDAGSFVGSLAIALREGFEAALLVAALLALVRKRGKPEHAKFVHAGWLAAIPAGLLTWALVGRALGGLSRELAEGIIALVAAFVLLGVTHWLIGQASAKTFMGWLGKRLGNAAGKGAAWGVMILAFIAAYREAFEIVLFYQALLLDSPGREALVWLGAGAGIVLLIGVVLILRMVGQKLQPRPFMLASSALLALLALVLVGKGVRALQEAGVLGVTMLDGWPELPAVGLHATVEGLVGQAILAILLIASALWPWISARRAKNEPPRATSPTPAG